MKFAILGIGTSDPLKLSKFTEINTKPEFRKASINMKMAYHSILQATENFNHLEDCSFVLGTSYGEIDNTKEFLKNLAVSGLARPILFQSSLHNGTLGFLALELKMKGPSFTISEHCFSGEKALLQAIDLIKADISPASLVTAYDIMSPALLSVLVHHYPHFKQWKDSAGSLILASDHYVREKKLTPLAWLDTIECFQYSQEANSILNDFNDSDAIYKIANAIQESKSEITLIKPDLSFSKFKWSFEKL